ncbi:MAG: LytTR family DNA-binding domain-containing protein [Casimicrobiaceae bacterium]
MDEAADLAPIDRGEDPPPPRPPQSSRWLDRIAVRSVNRIVIVQVGAIVRLEAEDNYVRIWADRLYLHKDTLSGLVAKLDPSCFLRVHRSHAINIGLVRELRPQLHGEYAIVLVDGTEIASGRSFKSRIQQAFGLA